MSERVRIDAVIQAAMDMEATPLLHELAPLGDTKIPNVALGRSRMTQRFALGELEEKSVLVVTSSIGLADAACATAHALALVDTPVVIAASTVGGLACDISVGDIVTGTIAIYGQMGATASGYAPGQTPQIPVDHILSEAAAARLDDPLDVISHQMRIGQVLSSGSFCTQEHAESMRRHSLGAIATDMEICMMAQMYWSAGVGWISSRATSGLCEPGADRAFRMDDKCAASHSVDTVATYLRML